MRSANATALDSISISGFKSLGSVKELELRPINVLIGPNGAGKSNLINVFELLHAIRHGQLQEYVARQGGAEPLLYFGSKTTQHVRVRISFSRRVNQYEIVLVPTSADELRPSSEAVYYWNQTEFAEPYEAFLVPRGPEAAISEASDSNVAEYVRRHLDRWRIYHFHDTGPASPLKKTADVHDNSFLRPDGSNLSSLLYLLRLRHRDAYDLLVSTLRQVAPFFDDFTLAPQRINEDKIRLEWKHRGSDAYFDATGMSDGTLRFVALATLLLQPSDMRPSVILIDEPELGLHPYAITVLASLVKQASVDTQVIVSTQSSFLLDHFEPEDVVVTERLKHGTAFRRLAQSDLSHWLEDYSLGQLWEKNEIGGRPAGGG